MTSTSASFEVFAGACSCHAFLSTVFSALFQYFAYSFQIPRHIHSIFFDQSILTNSFLVLTNSCQQAMQTDFCPVSMLVFRTACPG